MKAVLIIFFVFILAVDGLYAQCGVDEEDKGVYEQMRFGMKNHLYSDAKIRGKILLTKYGDSCPDLYFDVGWLSFFTESWWDAVEYLKYALRILTYDKTKFEFAYASVGRSYYELGYYKESIQYLDEAIKISPGAAYYKYRAMSYYKLEDYTRAMEDFNIAKKEGSDFNDTETEFYWDAASKVK